MFSRKNTDENRDREFKRLMWFIGNKSKEEVCGIIENISDMTVPANVKKDLLERVNAIYATDMTDFRHAWSKQIIEKIVTAKPENMGLVYYKAKLTMKGALKQSLRDRLFKEISEGTGIPASELKEKINNASDVRPEYKKSSKPIESVNDYMDRVHDKVYEICDYFGLEYEKQAKIEVGKYTFVVDVFIPDRNTIIDVVFEAKDPEKQKRIAWRMSELRKRFPVCIFMGSNEINQKTIALDKVNQALGLGYKAMDLMD